MAHSVTVSEASEKLGIPENRIRYAARNGRIPADRLYPGAPWEIDAEWVQKSAERRSSGSEE